MKNKDNQESRMGDEALAVIARRFKVLSDPRRLKVLQELKFGERCGKEIVEITGLPQSTVSKQLSMLVEGGIVERKQKGAMACFSIADPLMMEMCESICSSLKKRALREANMLEG